MVGEAEDGAGGVEAAGRLAPAVVLLDVGLRRNRTASAIVFVSTHDAADFGELARRSDALGFLPKAELSGSALLALLAQD